MSFRNNLILSLIFTTQLVAHSSFANCWIAFTSTDPEMKNPMDIFDYGYPIDPPFEETLGRKGWHIIRTNSPSELESVDADAFLNLTAYKSDITINELPGPVTANALFTADLTLKDRTRKTEIIGRNLFTMMGDATGSCATQVIETAVVNATEVFIKRLMKALPRCSRRDTPIKN